MSSTIHCQLTTKDLTILESLLETLLRQNLGDSTVARLLRQKINTATVTFREDVEADVATINSRIEVQIGDGPLQIRTLTHGGENALSGLSLPISTVHGLALLGLAEGAEVSVVTSEDGCETLRLVRVIHQPEAARRTKRAVAFAVVADNSDLQPAAIDDRAVTGRWHASRHSGPDDDDDPGPQAA